MLDQVNFVGVQEYSIEFCKGKIFLVISCAPTKFTWSDFINDNRLIRFITNGLEGPRSWLMKMILIKKSFLMPCLSKFAEFQSKSWFMLFKQPFFVNCRTIWLEITRWSDVHYQKIDIHVKSYWIFLKSNSALVIALNHFYRRFFHTNFIYWEKILRKSFTLRL